MVVFDASVVVKLFVVESLADMAEAVMEKYGSFFAPDILRIEVSSALTRKVRNRELSTDIVYKKLREWKEFLAVNAIRLIPAEELMEDAEKLSIELRHPLGDCLYLATANRHNTFLVTADQAFIDSLDGRFSNVRHLSSFTS